MLVNKPINERLLLIFGNSACMRIGLPEPSQGMLYHFVLEAYQMEFDTDQEMEVIYRNENWYFKDKAIREGVIMTISLENSETIMLLLSERKQTLKIVGRINLSKLKEIRIGSDYPNQVFYESSFGILGKHAVVYQENDSYYVHSFKEIYLNTKRMIGQKQLSMGDQIDIYGLHLILLEDWLICISFCGICRIAQNMLPSLGSNRGKENNQTALVRIVERNCEQDKQLHNGEIEIHKPSEPVAKQRTRLLLSIGPSITMAFPMLLMAFLSSNISGQVSNSFYLLTAGMTVCTGSLAVFWGLVNHFYRKHLDSVDEKDRRKQYREYLSNLNDYLQKCKTENIQILECRYPMTKSFIDCKKKVLSVAWNRYYLHQDYLFIRLGKGIIPFQLKLKPPKENGIIPEKLTSEALTLCQSFETLEDAPFGLDFFHVRQFGMIVSPGKQETENWIRLVILQIAASLCYTEVKLVCFYDKARNNQQEIADCMKWLPHNWSTDRKIRYLAGDESEAAEVIPVLTKDLEREKQGGEKKRRIPWYFFFLLDEKLIRGELLFRYLIDADERYPVSTIWLANTQEDLPRSCRHILSKKSAGAEIVIYGNEQIIQHKISIDSCSYSDTENYARGISGFRVKEELSQGQIPDKVSFLQLFDRTVFEGLDLKTRWRQSKPEERLKIPIGQGRGGRNIYLDIHEKFHGPHGLIAGTTGSGKSELLQTYLLSMAVCFSPQDVNFFMIDYKGGGTGNILRKLPHCAGVISNLSGKQIKRAMSAISSENKRRQKLLSEFQVNHIDHYTRLFREGTASEAMPHLILVIDEFAELKKEEPEFMQEIISLAQVGRSLGVHLILATQKPAGTVDDKIWSNARFRLCLKVQDRQDSMDMLHCADAAWLTAPGQCYLQIGNQEYYEMFQTAYCGDSYKTVPDQIPEAVLLTNTGHRVRTNSKTEIHEQTSILEALTDYIHRTATEYRYGRAKALWMPELPERFGIEILKETTSYYKGIKLKLGLCDDPYHQEQPLLFYDPVKEGNLAIFGGPATGKSTLLQTILCQLSFLEDYSLVQYLIVDYSRGSLHCFEAMPQCLSYLRSSSEQEIFFYHLQKLINQRKQILAGVSCVQFNQQADNKLPFVFMIVDGYRSFAEKLSERQTDFMIRLATEGVNYGIYLILSATAVNEIPTRVFEKIQNSITFELSDHYQYGDALRYYNIPVYPKENTRGRGLCKYHGAILEYQAAIVFETAGDYQRMQTIKQMGVKLCEKMQEKSGEIFKFPHIPEGINTMSMKRAFRPKRSEGTIPLGYSMVTGEIQALNYRKTGCFLVSGAERTGKRTLMAAILDSFLQEHHTVVSVDLSGNAPKCREGEIRFTTMEETQGCGIAEYLKKEDTSADYGVISVFLWDLAEFCTHLYDYGTGREQQEFWEKLAGGKQKGYFVMAVYCPGKNYNAEGTIFFRNFISNQSGIHLGGNAGAQRILSFDDLNYSEQNRWEKPGIGYWKDGHGIQTQKLFLPGPERNENDNN